MAPYPIKTSIFYTEEDRAWQDTDQSDILTTHNLQLPYIDSPQIFLGLNHMDLAIGARTIGVKSSTEGIESDTFQSRISIWGDGGMSSAGCTWVETAARNPDIKSGVCSTTRRSGKSFKIKFDEAFASTPTVLVWLGGFQVDARHSWDVGGWAEEVVPTGFTLNVKTGGNTILYQSKFSWVAFVESDKVCGGRVGGVQIPMGGNKHEPRYWDGKAEFPKAFEVKPSVALGVSRINASGIGIRFSFPATIVKEEGIDFKAKTWWHTAIEEADVSWIAAAAV